MIIEYDPPTLSSYTKMLEIVNYDEYLQEHRDLIEDVKYSLLSQTTGDVVIDDASSETELIIDILDILSKFNSTVKINFYLYLPQQAI